MLFYLPGYRLLQIKGRYPNLMEYLLQRGCVLKKLERDKTLSKVDETFVVHITNNDNASWQGQVTWTDPNETKSFRSALELIKLVDSVVRKEGEN